MVRLLYERLTAIPYREILKGISHYEQGREPSISQNVYFINIDKDIVFHMYDDRGCIIYSNSRDKLTHIRDVHDILIIRIT